MKVDHEQFAFFNYENVLDVKDKFKLGDVVYNPHLDEVGVIIQTHGNNEYRTDMLVIVLMMKFAEILKELELLPS